MDRRFILALSMPIALILIVLLLIYWSSQAVNPKEDFLFTLTKDGFCANGEYSVQHEKLVWAANKRKKPACDKITTPKLYRYLTSSNTVEAVTPKEAKAWAINTAELSPDGFRVENTHSDFPLGGIFFSYRVNDEYYLTGHGATKILPVSISPDQHEQFTFLGWIQS